MYFLIPKKINTTTGPKPRTKTTTTVFKIVDAKLKEKKNEKKTLLDAPKEEPLKKNIKRKWKKVIGGYESRQVVLKEEQKRKSFLQTIKKDKECNKTINMILTTKIWLMIQRQTINKGNKKRIKK